MVVWTTAIGQILSISLFGSGMLLGVLGLLLGISKNMSSKGDYMGLTFTSYAWIVALVMPNQVWAYALFCTGTLASTMTYTKILKKLPETNIAVIGIVVMMMYIVIGIASGAYAESIQSYHEGTAVNAYSIYSISQEQYLERADQIDMPHVCTPDGTSILANGTIVTGCEEQITRKGNVLQVVNDVTLWMMAIGTFLQALVKMIGYTLFMPVVIAGIATGVAGNTVLGIIMGLYLTVWTLVIVFKTAQSVLKGFK